MNQNFNLPLVNAHTHAAMVGLRGMGQDLPLDKWLNDCIWPAEAKMVNSDFIYEQTKAAILEMKSNGIAAFMDMYFYEDQVARAAEELGMHVILGEGLLDIKSQENFEKDFKETERLLEKYKDNKLVSVSVAPHSIYTVNEPNLIRCKELADKYNAILQIHLAETKKEFDDCVKERGLTPVAYLDKLGFLNERAVLAHCVWITDDDIKTLAERKAIVVHCPLSNLKLGSGIAPIAKMIKAGVIVALGTDGAASSDRLDIWEAGKFAALLQKGINQDASVLPVKEVIKMITINGMKSLGLKELNGWTIEKLEEEINANNYDYLYSANSSDLTFNL
jgi:5-methylthioadenosine/S-adenosylhomocysteine deaminase